MSPITWTGALRRREARNLRPHKAARVAMILYNERYAFKQKGGSMDFWDSLTSGEQQTCRELVAQIEVAPDEQGAR